MSIAKGNVNINAQAELAQIALKGLLSYSGIDTPESYYFDRPSLKALQKTPEGKNLSGLIINVNYLKLDLVSTSSETSSLLYEAETRSWKAPIPMLLLIESAFLFVLGLIMQLVTGFMPIAVMSYGIAAIVLIITLVFVIPTGNKIDKLIHRFLLPRLDRYIDIINEHIER